MADLLNLVAARVQRLPGCSWIRIHRSTQLLGSHLPAGFMACLSIMPEYFRPKYWDTPSATPLKSGMPMGPIKSAFKCDLVDVNLFHSK